MKHPMRVSRRQLRLPLERESKPLPAENRQEELVSALADLLLEALSEETDRATYDLRGGDESEDHA